MYLRLNQDWKKGFTGHTQQKLSSAGHSMILFQKIKFPWTSSLFLGHQHNWSLPSSGNLELDKETTSGSKQYDKFCAEYLIWKLLATQNAEQHSKTLSRNTRRQARSVKGHKVPKYA